MTFDWHEPPTEPMHEWRITDSVSIPLLDNYAGFCLAHFAHWWNARIEPLQHGQVWGYATPRPIRGHGLSRHGAGLAEDLNSLVHPSGKRGTVTDRHAHLIHARLYWMDRVSLGLPYDGSIPPGYTTNDDTTIMRWGGDYQRAPYDPMHTEWNRGTTPDVRGKRLATHLIDTPRGADLFKRNPQSVYVKRHHG